MMVKIFSDKFLHNRDTKSKILLCEKPQLIKINENCKNNDSNNFEKKVNEDFELINEIGEGSISKVYLYRDKKYKRNYALKKILPKNGKINHYELYISKTLNHKNIIQTYEIHKNTEKNVDYILMEYGTHGNIINFQNKFLKNNNYSESLLNFFVYQILLALKYCEKCHVLHQDLKPQNIVIDEYLNVKIIDFSISLKTNIIKSDDVQLKPCGTTFFIAPEVLKSKKVKKKDLNKIDLYSLGVIIYMLAFGEFPYGLNSKTKEFSKIIEKIDNNELKINNEDNYFSESFIDFLKKLLEKDINKRINIDEALNHYWVKGAKILVDEKEKMYNAPCFLGYLITDHFINFNQYLKADRGKQQCF